MNSVTVPAVDSALGCFSFPPGLGETFIPSPCCSSSGIRKAADGSGLQFFISFCQPVQCSPCKPPLKTPEFLLGSDRWGPNSVMSPKAGVQRKSCQTQPPCEAPGWGSPHLSWLFSQFWIQQGGEAVGGLVFLGACTQVF